MKNIRTYKCKDGRVRYYYKDENGKNHTGSYPRILMEEKLGRLLEPNEDVHHIAGNPSNNDLSNLEVVKHGEHQREHSLRYQTTEEICMICGKPFTMTNHMWSRFYVDLNRNRPRYLTCSKSCAAKAGGDYIFNYELEDRLKEVKKLWKNSVGASM